MKKLFLLIVGFLGLTFVATGATVFFNSRAAEYRMYLESARVDVFAVVSFFGLLLVTVVIAIAILLGLYGLSKVWGAIIQEMVRGYRRKRSRESYREKTLMKVIGKMISMVEVVIVDVFVIDIMITHIRDLVSIWKTTSQLNLKIFFRLYGSVSFLMLDSLEICLSMVFLCFMLKTIGTKKEEEFF